MGEYGYLQREFWKGDRVTEFCKETQCGTRETNFPTGDFVTKCYTKSPISLLIVKFLLSAEAYYLEQERREHKFHSSNREQQYTISVSRNPNEKLEPRTQRENASKTQN